MTRQNRDQVSEDDARRRAQQDITSEAEFFTRFMYEPGLEKHGFDKEKFKHHTSNLVTTALNEDEAQQVKTDMGRIQILQNYNETNYFADLPVYQVRERDGWCRVSPEEYAELKETEGVETRHAGYQSEEISQEAYEELKQRPGFDNAQLSTEVSNRFQEAKDVYIGRVNSRTAVAAGTKAALIRNNNTQIQEQEQDITRESTTDDPSWTNPLTSNKSSSRRRRKR